MSSAHEENDMEVTIEDFQFLSVEYLYHYLRFSAFPDVSKDRLKALFLKGYDIPLRDPDVFPIIVEAVNARNFDILESALTPALNNVVRTVEPVYKDEPLYNRGLVSVAVGGGPGNNNDNDEIAFQVWSLIMDAYFADSDSSTSLNLMRTLLFFPIYEVNLEPIQEFVTRYNDETDTDIRTRMVSGNIYTATFI